MIFVDPVLNARSKDHGTRGTPRGHFPILLSG